MPDRHGGKSENCFALMRYVCGSDMMAEVFCPAYRRKKRSNCSSPDWNELRSSVSLRSRTSIATAHQLHELTRRLLPLADQLRDFAATGCAHNDPRRYDEARRELLQRLDMMKESALDQELLLHPMSA